jgi:hypothetical protein
VGGGVPHLVAAGQLTRPVSAIETAAIAVYWAIGVGVAHALGAIWIPILWVASVATVFWSGVRLRIWTEHLGTRDTHRIHVPLWLEIFLMPHNIGMHWEHHHFPSVPFYNLGHLRRRLPPGERSPRRCPPGRSARRSASTSSPPRITIAARGLSSRTSSSRSSRACSSTSRVEASLRARSRGSRSMERSRTGSPPGSPACSPTRRGPMR